MKNINPLYEIYVAPEVLGAGAMGLFMGGKYLKNSGMGGAIVDKVKGVFSGRSRRARYDAAMRARQQAPQSQLSPAGQQIKRNQAIIDYNANPYADEN